VNQWKGEPIEDKSILVWTDQGLGDSIMLARFIPMIRARRVVVYCDAAVFRLLRHSLPGVEVLMKGWAFPRTDLHVPFMSLMQCFGIEGGKGHPAGALPESAEEGFQARPEEGRRNPRRDQLAGQQEVRAGLRALDAVREVPLAPGR
jgi:hypothetical protein